ncbi:MAG TPA: hypothetical protein VNO30_13635 [Kofleriaceae bacterium]|nr:hypothetical protein [Kofleriaceae bacterium]
MMTRPALYLLASTLTAAIGCTSDLELPADDTADAPDAPPAAACTVTPIDVDRSLFVSPTAPPDQAALRARFSVSRIMNHILASSGAGQPASGAELFRRWWDTQNSSASAAFADNPHCDDNGGRINGFPVACQRNEGILAQAQPDSHFPVALVYRPDLTASDGSTCGEARIVIAKPADAGGRNLAIFEAAIPNPEPGCGVVGCRKVAQFWANLSTIDSFPQRLDALERFYFTGLDPALDGVATQPVLDAANLGLPDDAGARHGQIRTNQFMAGPRPPAWQLREFQLARTCTAPGSCKLLFEPVTVKTNPFGVLFNDLAPEPRGAAFRDEFVGQVGALAAPELTAISMSIGNEFNAGQSNSQGPENQYGLHFGQGNPGGFRTAIADELAALGSPLTADNIVARATAQSCAGCHQLSNGALIGGIDPLGNPLRWPPSANFVHVVENGVRSMALNRVFLPRRRQILEQLLADTCTGTCAAPRVADPTPIAGQAMVH